MKTNKNFIGTKIKEALRERRIKQIEVCRAANLSPSRMSNYISGAREPDLETLSKIAHILGKPLDYFSHFFSILNAEKDHNAYIESLKEKKSVKVDVITDLGTRRLELAGDSLAELLKSRAGQEKVFSSVGH